MDAEEYIVSLIERLDTERATYRESLNYQHPSDKEQFLTYGRIAESYTVVGMLERDLKEIRNV